MDSCCTGHAGVFVLRTPRRSTDGPGSPRFRFPTSDERQRMGRCLQVQQRMRCQSGTQPKGYDAARGRTGDQVEVVPNGLTVQTVALEIGQDLSREDAPDAAAIE